VLLLREALWQSERQDLRRPQLLRQLCRRGEIVRVGQGHGGQTGLARLLR